MQIRCIGTADEVRKFKDTALTELPAAGVEVHVITDNSHMFEFEVTDDADT